LPPCPTFIRTMAIAPLTITSAAATAIHSTTGRRLRAAARPSGISTVPDPLVSVALGFMGGTLLCTSSSTDGELVRPILSADGELVRPILSADGELVRPILSADGELLRPILSADGELLRPILSADGELLRGIRSPDGELLRKSLSSVSSDD